MDSRETVEGQCLVMPEHISTRGVFMNVFGNHETDQAARDIVIFSREKGEWVAFTAEEIDQWYGSSFSFHRMVDKLVGMRWIQLDEIDQKYRVTVGFIARCWGAHPQASVLIPA